MTDLMATVEMLSELTPIEAGNLSVLLRERLGIKEDPKMVIHSDSLLMQPTEPEEKTEFSISYLGFDPNKKLDAIKAIRPIINLDLKATKEFVEGGPQLIKEGLTKQEVEELKTKLEGAGIKIEVK